MTMQKTTRALLTLCTAALALSCTTEERATTTGSSISETTLSQPGSTRAILYSPRVESVFANTLSSANVMAGIALLESEGYTYVDTNSMILVRRSGGGGGERSTGTATASAFWPDPNKVPDTGGVIRIDTILWLSFENPTHDMGMHTAIISARDHNSDITRLVELDVSTELPRLIREGKFVEGEYVPGDAGTEGWLLCMGTGLVGSAVACAVTNGGYGHCLAGTSLGTLAACTFNWAFSS